MGVLITSFLVAMEILISIVNDNVQKWGVYVTDYMVVGERGIGYVKFSLPLPSLNHPTFLGFLKMGLFTTMMCRR